MVLAECENSFATELTPVHLREVGKGEVLRRGGALHARSLCGRDVDGWDTGVTYPDAASAQAACERFREGPGRLCAQCASTLTPSTTI